MGTSNVTLVLRVVDATLRKSFSNVSMDKPSLDKPGDLTTMAPVVREYIEQLIALHESKDRSTHAVDSGRLRGGWRLIKKSQQQYSPMQKLEVSRDCSCSPNHPRPNQCINLNIIPFVVVGTCSDKMDFRPTGHP